MKSDRIEQLIQGNTAGFGAAIAPRTTGRRVENVLEIPVDAIRPDPDNARKHFDTDELTALADDMRRHGQLQNVVVWNDIPAGQYQLIAGERRLRAAKLAGMKTLVAMIVPREMKDDIRAEMAFAENMSRAELKPTEVARHWKALLERWGCSTRELAARVGVAQSTISKRLALLKLDADTQHAVDAGTVRRTHVVEATRTRRRSRGGKRAPRGTHQFNAGTVTLKRGHTLADLVAEIEAANRQAEPGQAAA
jgi:ParB family chromosome partitioning protein